MKYQIQRYSDNGESTLGLMHQVIDNALEFQAYTLEDEYRAVKVKHETCIPARLYSVKFNRNDTPLTLKYRNKFDWFTYHLEIQDVEGFQNVYLHIGNTDDNSSGCVLLGDGANNNVEDDGFISNSTKAYKRFYLEVSDELAKNDGRVWVEIRDVKEIM